MKLALVIIGACSLLCAGCEADGGASKGAEAQDVRAAFDSSRRTVGMFGVRDGVATFQECDSDETLALAEGGDGASAQAQFLTFAFAPGTHVFAEVDGLRLKSARGEHGDSFLIDALQSADGRIVGTTGCNRLNATYAVDRQSITIAHLTMTRMACADAGREAALARALTTAATWTIVGAHLDLRDADGTAVARFESRNL